MHAIALLIAFLYLMIRCALCFAEPHPGNTFNLVASLLIFGVLVVGSLEVPAYV